MGLNPPFGPLTMKSIHWASSRIDVIIAGNAQSMVPPWSESPCELGHADIWRTAASPTVSELLYLYGLIVRYPI